MTAIRIVNKNQPQLLTTALNLTMSEGFMNDAHAAAAYDARTGDYLAIAVFQNRSVRGTEVHFGANVSRALVRRDVMTGLFAYAFRLLKIPRLIAPIAAWNAEAQIAALKSGFVIIGHVSRGALDGSDAILFAMTPDSCRWLPPPVKPAPSEEPATRGDDEMED